MVTVDFNVEPGRGQIDVDEVIDKLEFGDYEEITDEELRAFIRLLTESEEFSATSMRSEMKEQMSVFIEKVNAATERRDQRVEELND